MARQLNFRDLTPTLTAARRWIDQCLVEDGSLLGGGKLWTTPLIEEVRAAFVDHPDAGEDNFITKLRGQMDRASPAGRQLMAEMMWVLLLFTSKTGPDKKRQDVREIWSWSGETLALDHPMVQAQTLQGVGSTGVAYSIGRWRELTYLIALGQSLKAKALPERQLTFSNYQRFMEWIEAVPRAGDHQFRHMLRYFAFPERVERMSSNRDRIAVLEGFAVAQRPHLIKWSDRQFDDALLTLRQTLEAQHPGLVLDFYETPLKSRWRAAKGDDEATVSAVTAREPDSPAMSTSPSVAAPTNLILYGPPGTGKTHWLRHMFAQYTDAPSTVDTETWLHETLAGFGWRSVIAAALADIGRPARVPEIRAHGWVQAKAKQRGRAPAGVQATLWGYLQEHTPQTSATVNISTRRPPFLFDKRDTGDWHLLPDWQEIDDESAALLAALKAGPKAATDEIRRYKVVTFHPSFGYEDFVRGIRPVSTAEDGSTQFMLVDGKFKQICDEAHANPTKRYALFIDEINRANIAKVFGELITLIEADKRAVFDTQGRLVEGMAVHLPGGDETDAAERPFGVPKNLDIYGTMNTADRSIALLDVALRRRFRFEERGPDYGIPEMNRAIGPVHLGALLERINDRLEYLLDRDHRIGHAYLMRSQSLDDLRDAFALQVIPLLQEYFFDDFSRVALVLSTTGEQPFVAEESLSFNRLFVGRRLDGVPGDRARHVITPPHSWTLESFSGICGDTLGDRALLA